ncbi:hypothetical protein [Shewanella insulae]|uniref:hypothetical protein n=1 Tax=Shewanella insulae TaxID=2681496 RepID=UPI0024815B45|nr:hypothetical protein [Shewanella insulae]
MSISELPPEKTDIHPFDKIIKPLGSVWFISLLIVFSIIAGVCLSVVLKNWTWFGRFGSIITIAGLLLSNSNVFADGIYLSHRANGQLPIKKKSGEVQWTNQESRTKGKRVFWGVVYAILGTVIWGFGDLLGPLLTLFT